MPAQSLSKVRALEKLLADQRISSAAKVEVIKRLLKALKGK